MVNVIFGCGAIQWAGNILFVQSIFEPSVLGTVGVVLIQFAQTTQSPCIELSMLCKVIALTPL